MTRASTRRTLLVVAGLASTAALAITASGGYEFTVAGTVIRGHRVDRLVWLGVLSAAGYLALGGRLWRAGALSGPKLPGRLALLLSIGVFSLGWIFGSRSVGGSDSWGYMSQAHGWLRLELLTPQPWVTRVPWPDAAETFRPLGLAVTGDGTALAPVYSPGLPMLMAAAMMVAGACAAFSVVPLLGAVAVYNTYRLGRWLASGWVGLGAAWLLASSPAFCLLLLQPMSDVPVLAAWSMAFLLAARQTTPAAFLSGLAAASAILIRVNHAPNVVALVAWFAWLAWERRRTDGRRALWPLVWFLAGTLPGAAVMAFFNAELYGSPLRFGYGATDAYFSTAHVVPNLARYAVWLTDTQTPLIWIGTVALLVPLGRWWPVAATRRMAACMALFAILLAAQYSLFLVFEEWSYLRFLLAAAPFVFICMLVLIDDVFRRLSESARHVLVLIVVLLPMAVGISGRRYDWRVREHQAYFQVAARVVENATEPGSVILSQQHSGSLRYYAGRMTLRFDYLDPAWLERAVTWLAERGAHPYALLEEWEVEHWRQRFGTHGRLGRLELRPIRSFTQPAGMVLYDLVADGPENPRVVSPVQSDYDCRPPVPLAFSLGR